MTTGPFASNKQVSKRWDAYSMIAVSFEDDRDAYNALTLLKDLDSQQRVGVDEAVVVVRGEDGQVFEKDRTESTFLPGTAGGGLIGLLIGIIGGPLGMLIGGAGGLYAGALFDLHDVDESESALAEISRSVKLGRTALLAVVTEQTPEVIDAAMTGVGGTVQRRSRADVEAEVAAAEKAQRKAKWEARKELVRGRHEHNNAAIQAKIEEMKNKLHRNQKTPAASADKAPIRRG
jgi:uncharacterized membrane protein